MPITCEQIYSNVSILCHCIAAGEAGLNRQINQISLVLTCEGLVETASFNQALIISPNNVFNTTSTSDHVGNLVKERKISGLVLTGCSVNPMLKDLCNRHNIPLFNLGDNISPALVAKKISEYYGDYIGRIENNIDNDYPKLVDLVTQGHGIKRIIKEAADILGNPLIMTDESYLLVGYSSSREVVDPIWQRQISSGYCPIDIVETLRQKGFVKQLQKERSPVFLTIGELSRSIRSLVSEITIGGQLKGYISLLEYDKPITSIDQKTLKFVVSIIALEFAKSDAIAKARGNYGQELLRDLVSGNIGSESMVQNRIKSLNWTLEKFMQVVVVSNIEKQYISAEHYMPIQSMIMKAIPSSKLSFTSNRIVILATGNSVSMLQKILPDIEKYCKLHTLRLGIGRPYKTLSEVSGSYNEGEKALQLATSIKRSGHIHYYEDLAVYDMLTNVKDNYKTHPGLLRLTEYDKNEGTDYFKTLSTYLRCGHNLSHTADALLLHRNTILYRLKKIEEILQSKLNKHNICLEIELGILLLELM